jgi:hypothetical protein
MTIEKKAALAGMTQKVASMSIDQRVKRMQELVDSGKASENLDEFAKLLFLPETEVTY